MELSAAEFIKLVTTGSKRVSGAFVTGPVRLADCEVINTDWADCVFDSSIELRGCTLSGASKKRVESAAGRMEQVLRCLDLSRSRIAGGLVIAGVVLGKVSSAPQERDRPVSRGRPPEQDIPAELALEATVIEGDLAISGLSVDGSVASSKLVTHIGVRARRCRVDGDIVVNHLLKFPVRLNCERVTGGGGLTATGRFTEIGIPHAVFGGNILIELAPRLPTRTRSREGGDEEELETTKIDLCQSRVRGDAVVTSHHETSEPYSQAAAEGIDLLDDDVDDAKAPQGRIAVIVQASKASVDRDLVIGREPSDYTDFDRRLQLERVDLSRIRVGGNILLAHADLTSFPAVEENTHEYQGVRLRRGRAESVRIYNITVDMKAAAALPAGDSLEVLDLMDLRVQREIDVVGVTGVSPEPLSLNARAVSLRQAECATLLLRGIELLDGDPEVSVLGIDATGISVADEAHIGKPNPEARDPFVDFSEAMLGCLSLSEPLPEGRVHLTGAQVGRWGMAARDDSGNQESFQAYKRLLQCSDTLDVAQYVAVERRLGEIGKRHDADKMHVYWKRLERGRLRGYRKFASFLHDTFLGYGTQVWRPALMLVLTFVVSMFAVWGNHGAWLQVSDSKQAELAECGYRCITRWEQQHSGSDWASRLGDAVAVTTKSLVPIVDLQLAGHLEPVPQTAGVAWVSLMRLFGYLLWPIFLTGLLAQLLPQGRNAR